MTRVICVPIVTFPVSTPMPSTTEYRRHGLEPQCSNGYFCGLRYQRLADRQNNRVTAGGLGHHQDGPVPGPARRPVELSRIRFEGDHWRCRRNGADGLYHCDASVTRQVQIDQDHVRFAGEDVTQDL